MSYSDSIMILGPELSVVQAETAAAVVKDYYISFGYQIEEFGIVITEDWVAQATDLVVKLQSVSAVSGSVTELIALTVGNSNTNLNAATALEPLRRRLMPIRT